jgi:hypothetical protein
MVTSHVYVFSTIRKPGVMCTHGEYSINAHLNPGLVKCFHNGGLWEYHRTRLHGAFRGDLW